MKKLFSIITIIALFVQLTPVQNVHAVAVYDDIYDLGDIYLVRLGGTVVEKYTKADATPFTSSTPVTGLSNPLYTMFLPNGDMVIYTMGNVIRCFTAISDYATECSWSPLTVTATSYTDPSTGNVTTPGGDVLSGSLSFMGAIATNGDIWMSMTNGTLDGRFVVQVTTTSSIYDTVNVYDMHFGTDEETAPAGIAIDHMGDVWVTSWYTDNYGGGFGNLSNYNDKVYCLDSSNSYESCTGNNFDPNGGITLDTESGPYDVAIGIDNNIYVTGLTTRKLYKIDRSLNFSTSSVLLNSIATARYLAIDTQGQILVTSDDGSGLPSGYLQCFDQTLSSCGATKWDLNTDGVADGIFVDKNNDVWILEDSSDRLYCFDSSNDLLGCAQPDPDAGGPLGNSVYFGYTNFTNVDEPSCSNIAYTNQSTCETALEVWTVYSNSYLSTGSMAMDTGGNVGSDASGSIITLLMNASAGQGQTTVSATVDPTISLVLSDNSCALGTLTSATVNGCAVVATISANAGTGYTGYVKDENNGTLNSATDSIPAVSASPISPGDEEFGISTTDTTNVDIVTTTNCNTVPDTATSVASALTTATQIFASGSVPVANDAITLCVSASVTDTTPAGSYSDIMTIIVVGHY